MTATDHQVWAFQNTGGAPTIGYIAAANPDIAKAMGGVVHPTQEAASSAIDAADEALRGHLNVYEVLTYVSKDPMPPAMKVGI